MEVSLGLKLKLLHLGGVQHAMPLKLVASAQAVTLELDKVVAGTTQLEN